MATFKEISAADVKTTRSVLNQLVDVIQEDISGSATRKSYQMFVTGGVGPGVTSSLYQTVYDQDFSLQTANALFDMTVGLYHSGSTAMSSSSGVDSNGKLLFPSSSLMMREKVDIYKQYASSLLGDSDTFFTTPFGSSEAGDVIDAACFVSFKRLFTRDRMKRETFALKMYQSASQAQAGVGLSPFRKTDVTAEYEQGFSNLHTTSTSSVKIYTDFGSSQNKRRTFGGAVGNLVDSSDTSRNVGLVFYDAGTIVLNLGGTTANPRAINGAQIMSGTISAMTAIADANRAGVPRGMTVLGGNSSFADRGAKSVPSSAPSTPIQANTKFVPDFMVSGSIDNIVDHLATCRFQSGSLTAATFQNNTNINSTLIFCRSTADEFNYSSNPTYTDSSNRIRVIDEGQEDVQRSFSFITTVGLYDVNDNLLAVAKLSRPIEKNDEKDLTIRVRLDF